MGMLYFPDNKLEYIPSVISLVIIVILAVLVLRIVIKHSRKESQQAKELEKRILEAQASSNNEQ